VNFDNCFTRLLGNEGGYCNDPNDPGGETNWGICKRDWPSVDIAHLSQADAKAIYRPAYWDKVRADDLPEAVRFEAFDMSVNIGLVAAIKVLQRAASVADDGVLGPVTLTALAGAEPQALLRRVQAARLRYYTKLKGWPVFGAGWVNRVANNMEA